VSKYVNVFTNRWTKPYDSGVLECSNTPPSKKCALSDGYAPNREKNPLSCIRKKRTNAHT
jgi:hypothetical protein